MLTRGVEDHTTMSNWPNRSWQKLVWKTAWKHTIAKEAANYAHREGQAGWDS